MAVQSSSHICQSSQRLRYVRLNPRFDRDETLHLLKSEIQTSQNYSKESYPIPVPWLNSKEHQLEFFAIPGEFCLNPSTSFQSGRVYGMDVTSGAAVAALLFDLYDVGKVAAVPEKQNEQIQKHDAQVRPLRVLDLCCAPGLKLCMMADLAPSSSVLVGVDISSQRISLCKNIVKKYHIDENTSASKSTALASKSLSAKLETTNATVHSKSENYIHSGTTIRLYCTNGTTFGMDKSTSTIQNGLVFDSNAAMEEVQSRGKRKRMNKSARAREKRRLLELQRKEEVANNAPAGDAENIEGDASHSETIKLEKKETIHNNGEKNDGDSGTTFSVSPFDRVLVDAECSTDGAIRHIEKRQSSLTSRSAAWDDTNMDELVDLQKRLIDSGFRLLKRGGIMIYSTCSLSSKQNEEVVLWLLDKCKDAFVIHVSFSTHNKSSQNLAFIEEGSIPGTVRFNPKIHEAKDGNAEVDLLPGSGFFLAKIGKREHPA